MPKKADSKDFFISAEDAFEKFIWHTQASRPEFLSGLSNLNNGFEAWLKIEFFLWLQRTYDLVDQVSIGMECSLTLSECHPDLPKLLHKRVDLWVRDKDEKTHHYIELKVPFSNNNKGKMFGSAARDLWFMCHLNRATTEVRTGSVLVMGVDFGDQRWQEDMQIVFEQSKPEYISSIVSGGMHKIEGGGMRPIYWQCVTGTYSEQH